MSGRAPSSQHYHHNNNPSSSSNNHRSQQRPPAVTTTGGAAASSANITCSLCGCLNFSNEPTCDSCRQKETTASSNSAGAAAGASASGSGKSSPVVTLPVSPRTAILKKQTPVPPPRTGIVTGLRHGLPIDAYRNGGRRNSLLGAKINRDGESPAASQSSSSGTSSGSAQTLARSNLSSNVDQRTGGTSSASDSRTTSSSSQNPRSEQTEKPSQGKELYQRVLVQQRQSLEAKRKAGANSYKSISAADEKDEKDEKDSIARFVDATVGAGSTPSVPESPATSSRPSKRPRTAGNSRGDVIDLISSSDEDGDDDDNVKSVDGGKQNADAPTSTTRTNGDKPSKQEPRAQTPTSDPTATTKPSPRTEPGASAAVPVVSARQPPAAVASVRVPTAANTAAPSPAVAARPQDTVRESETSDEGTIERAPFLSRQFPVIEFDPIDFPPTDAAAALKLRARRSSSGLETSGAGLSQQQTAVTAPVPTRSAVVVPPAVAAPSLRTPHVHQEKEREKATPAPTPAPVTAPVVQKPIPAPVAPVVQRPAAAAAPVVQNATPTPAVPGVQRSAPASAAPVSQKPAPAPTAPVVQKTQETAVGTQGSAPIVFSNAGADVAMVEVPQQADSSALSTPASASSIQSPRLKRTASGISQEQAIELGDDDESSQEQIFSTRGELFLSRMFQSVEFNASDFSTVHDGLHIARRSKIAAQSKVPEPPQQQQRATGVVSSQEIPTNAATARNDAVLPLRISNPVSATSATPSRPATIPPDSNITTTTTAFTRTSASPLETRAAPAAQPAVPARQVNVVPMSPREPSVQRVEPKLPASRVEVKAPVPSVQRAELKVPAPSVQRGELKAPAPSVERSAPAPISGARPVPPSQGPAPVSRPAATSASAPKPTTTPVPAAASKPREPAPVNAPAALPSSINRSSETARPATTTSANLERTTSAATMSSPTTTTILLARKKIPQATPVSVMSGAPAPVTRDMKTNTVNLTTTTPQQAAKKEEVIKAREVVTIVKRISKPLALGDCSADFMGFMKDFVDGDDDEPMSDEEETRKLHLQLLEVVDLTNLTDSDDDDSSDDGYEFSEPPTPTAAAAEGNSAKPTLVLSSGFSSQGMLHPTPAFGVVSGLGPAGFFASDPSRTAQRVTFTAAAGGIVTAGIAGPPKTDRRRAVRQLEPCVICEEKKWVKTLIHCKDCGKYYHKKCAKDYGDEKICWNCELDGMIDDSDLTETARDTVVGMLSTLRHASSSSSEGEEEDDDGEVVENADGGTSSSLNNGEGEESRRGTDDEDDDEDDGEEESKRDNAVPATRKPPLLPGGSTKSMQRWKTFLDVSTSMVDKTFHEVTKSIDAELQSEEQKAKYSKGFTTPEIFQAQISEVLDSYADLQDQLDREAREKPRGPSGTGAGADGQEASATTESVVSPTVRENSSMSTRMILDLSGSSDAPVQSVQSAQHVNREVVISDGM